MTSYPVQLTIRLPEPVHEALTECADKTGRSMNSLMIQWIKAGLAEAGVPVAPKPNGNLRHRTPCKECPWRRDSLKGYLGGNTPETYADTVLNNQVPACHMHDYGPEDDRTAFCAGALATMANACILPDEIGPGQAGARNARKAVGPRPDTFGHPRTFYEYHAGKPYQVRFLRMA